MGMFDDLIPTGGSGGGERQPLRVTVYPNGDPRNEPGYVPPRSSGMFDDLVPAVDFNRPVGDVRADIAKLQGPERKRALDQWAERFVSKEREQGGIGIAADNTVRTLARGSFVGPLLDEATAASQKVLQIVSGGYLGSDYDEALAYQRARDKAVDTDYPIASTLGKVVGGVAGGIGAARQGGVTVGGVLAGGPLAAWKPAETVMGNVKQGAVIGPAYGAFAGYGEGEGTEDRVSKAKTGAGLGLLAGVALPPAIAGAGKALSAGYDAVSPVVARYGTEAKNMLQNYGVLSPPRPPTTLSAAAADGLPGQISGAEAAADQTIANQLARANIGVVDVRQRMAQSSDAARMGSNSYAQNMLAPVDMDPSLQRLAGSIARQDPAAANVGQRFLFGRQTGTTPRGSTPQDVAEMGLPTRPAFSPPITGAQAERTLGRNFGTAQDNPVPMGQFDRIRDAFKRALRIADTDYHGHGRNAHRTDEQILAAAKDEAKTTYSNYYKAGEGVDLSPNMRPLIDTWRQKVAVDEPQAVQRMVNRTLAALERALSPAGTKSHAERVDKVKQWLDDQIDAAMGKDGQRYLAGQLIELKNGIIAAVEGVQTNGLGPAYRTARDQFSSKMDARKALQMGRDAMNDESDIGVDAYRSLTNDADRKLFRLGMLDAYEKKASPRSRVDDTSRMFDNPRVQELLTEVIPRSERSGDTFANRPERFGRYLEDQKSMTQTRNTVFGGSQTQRNIQDDQASNAMDSLSTMFSGGGQPQTMTAMAAKAATAAINKLFGFRADVAEHIARKLFTSDPAEIGRLLRALEERGGANRMQQFERLMRAHQARFGQSAARAGVGTFDEGQQ